MREIKFRAWDTEYKQWITITSIEEGSDYFTFGELNTPYILCQYTGIKDQTGKEIYEGHIMKDKFGDLFQVVFEPGAIGMKRIIARKNSPTYRMHQILGEVIGNIYENPEFLDSREDR